MKIIIKDADEGYIYNELSITEPAGKAFSTRITKPVIIYFAEEETDRKKQDGYLASILFFIGVFLGLLISILL